MPLVDGKKFAYTPEGMRAAAKKAKGKPGATSVAPMARRAKAKNPDEIKTKADLLAGNLGNTLKNMGGY